MNDVCLFGFKTFFPVVFEITIIRINSSSIFVMSLCYAIVLCHPEGQKVKTSYGHHPAQQEDRQFFQQNFNRKYNTRNSEKKKQCDNLNQQENSSCILC